MGRAPALCLEAVARPGVDDDQIRLHCRHGLPSLFVQDMNRGRGECLDIVVFELAEAVLYVTDRLVPVTCIQFLGSHRSKFGSEHTVPTQLTGFPRDTSHSRSCIR